MASSDRDQPFSLPTGINEVLRKLIRNFIVDHIPSDPDAFVTYAAKYFSQQTPTDKTRQSLRTCGNPLMRAIDLPRPPPPIKKSLPKPTKFTPNLEKKSQARAPIRPRPVTSDNGVALRRLTRKPCPYQQNPVLRISWKKPSSAAEEAAGKQQQQQGFSCCYCSQGKGSCQCTSNDDFGVNPSSLDLVPSALNECRLDWWLTKKSLEDFLVKRRQKNELRRLAPDRVERVSTTLATVTAKTTAPVVPVPATAPPPPPPSSPHATKNKNVTEDDEEF